MSVNNLIRHFKRLTHAYDARFALTTKVAVSVFCTLSSVFLQFIFQSAGNHHQTAAEKRTGQLGVF